MVNVSITKRYVPTPDYQERLDSALEILAEMAYRQRLVEAGENNKETPVEVPQEAIVESSPAKNTAIIRGL